MRTYVAAQFDDMSSQFNCQTSSKTNSGTNSVNYTITYCPGEATGIPVSSAKAKPVRTGAR